MIFEFSELMSLICTDRGDLDSIKILVENGVDFMVGNDDMRTVSLFLHPQVHLRLIGSITFGFVFIEQAAHLAASNGMISVLDYLFAQVLRDTCLDFDFSGRDKWGETGGIFNKSGGQDGRNAT